MRTADFHYDLPSAAIAQSTVEPRDAARLLVGSTLEDLRFRDLPRLLAPGDLLVVNRTRVRHARLAGRRAGSGGAVEALLTKRIDGERWEALLRPSRRLRPGSRLEFSGIDAEVVDGPEGGVAVLRLWTADGDVEDVLGVAGTVPLPPYYHGDLPDPDRYQTMFAKTPGSAAAPTAGLHFTPRVVADLTAGGVDIAEVELEVGLDTFRPMQTERVEDHRMHRERYRVPEEAAAAVASARRRGSRVIAVGTTVVRTLESVAAGGAVAAGEGDTGLFIAPGHEFRAVDAMVTNFHAPATTLIVLVAAFVGERWRDVYAHALDTGYRFLSFGDACFLERPQ
jgi:S-adenosylmethionine:tRNA ribosyltransferase-isomerase